ncbi:MAG: NAD(P)H-dependent oxidoreductase [Endozoicomonas sp. (ex Botrylloides leachii)]|nr:NAD(P)H-dependent oxidoreductase [Endozoicomonas sp. (ex Botrylloides leachii)]
MKLMFLAGSFRKKSATQGIIRTIVENATDYQYCAPRIDKLPFYSEDLDGSHRPDIVIDFINQVSGVDGIVLCSPEYNHSIPAVLKNAIDWASRPAFKSSLKDKPITIISQTNSEVGGARLQAHLKLVLDSTLSRIYPSHEMMISNISTKISDEQRVIDDITVSRLKRHINMFISFIA